LTRLGLEPCAHDAVFGGGLDILLRLGVRSMIDAEEGRPGRQSQFAEVMFPIGPG
jgi:hypothetical protein